VGTTNLEGRLVQYEGGRTLVTFDVLGEQTNDRLIVDGTAIMGGTIETRAKSLLPGNYEFLTATDLTLTAHAADRLLYTWEATVSDGRVSAAPTRSYRPEGLNLSATSAGLVSYLERAWDNADRHHAQIFGYKHELAAVEDYNTLLETLGGQALNAQPLQMRMVALSGLGDSLACPTVTPVGLRLEQDNCVWARITGDVAELSGSSDNLGFHASGGGLRVGMQHTLNSDWTVGAALGYGLNYLTSRDFTSNGQFFDLSLSTKRDVGQWRFGGALGYAQGWFNNNRRLSMPGAGIAPGFNDQYTSSSRLSIYGAKLRAAYTFEQESHYIRPYVDLDVTYSRAPGFGETGPGKLALQMNSASQWNVGITPMVEFGKDHVTADKTRVKVFVSAGATFLPNNQQKSSAAFVGASDLNGTFDVVNGGPNVVGRLNLGVQVYAKEGYEVRAQYGLQAGENYWSQSLSANLTYRF
jgi:outer membrane autotransporter protein